MNPASPLIRLATLDDAPRINQIRNHYILNTTSNLEYDALTDEVFTSRFKVRDSKTPYYVIEEKNKILGWGSLSYFGDRPGYRITAEIGIYLVESAQGRGLGKRLLSHLVSEATRFGFHSVLSRVVSGNASSNALHEHCGFEKVGTLPEVGQKFGQLLDVYFYMKKIHIASNP